MQTRLFETRDDTELLSASAAVLQDLGFQVTESVREVGFLRAAKERSAREYGQYITRSFVFVLSAAVLQDLGFQVTESVREVGFLRAAKERSAREYGQYITRGFAFVLSIAASVLGGGNSVVWIPVDLQQQICASLVARPLDGEGQRHEIRVLFYRLVWKGDGQSGDHRIPPGEQRMQMIRDAGIYQQFFARLSKAVFLEAHKI